MNALVARDKESSSEKKEPSRVNLFHLMPNMVKVENLEGYCTFLTRWSPEGW